jgi:RHS repeat-associated protein
MKNLTHIKATILILLLTVSFGAMAQQDLEVSKYDNQRELTANHSITYKPGFVVPAGSTFHSYITPTPDPVIKTKLKTQMNAIITYNGRVQGLVDLRDTNNSVSQVNVEVQTLDNYGRIKEVQQVKVTPGFNDIVQLKAYDALGNEVQKYLPFVREGGYPNFNGSGYTAEGTGFYNGLDNTYAVPATGNSYSEVKYDNSPLEIVKETSAPGYDFSMGQGHTIRTTKLNNESDIINYKVIGGVLTRDALPRQTTCVRTEDENVPQHDETTNYGYTAVVYARGAMYEYKDFMGQVILKRHIRAIGQDSGGNDIYETASTYYVYDDRGNLKFVLPPNTNPDAGVVPGQPVLDNLCYQYKYDDQQHLIAKKLPGKGWEFMLYNKQDKVVMSQDAVQRGKTPQEWNIIKYDAQGRAVITGIYADAGSTAGTDNSAAMQASVNLQGVDWETRTNTGNGYTNTTYPTTWATTLSVNYYDDYNLPGGNPYPYNGTEVSNQTRGMATASLTNVLGTTNMLWSVSYYDEDGRNIKTFKQHYKGGIYNTNNYDELTTTYNFTGVVLTSTRSHKVGGIEQVKTINEYTYDHVGRKRDSWETINTGTRTLLARNQYDELGNLFKKKLHSTNGGTTFLQTITYSYNERGWLTRAQADKLDINLRYSQPTQGAAAQYNGNIAEQEYTGNNSGNRWFKYSYDGYNRLTKADYNYNNQLGEKIAYDLNGNITALIRGDSTSTATTYTYANSGASNQLASITGGLTGSYSYDANGNALTDTRRGATLTYNQLNLPATVTGTNAATYLYDAAGTKLSSVQTTGSTTTTREYISGIQYTNGAIDFIQTEEGSAVRNVSDGTYKYQYSLKDNLGNTRVTIDNNGGIAEVVQEDEYYAFGLDAPKFRLTTENKYLYNGKEKQEALADEFDYGARFYDPVIARWTSVDLLVENGQESTTPYGYVFDDPIKNTDPDGREPEEANGCCGIRNAIKSVLAVATAIPNAILPDRFKANLVKAVDKTHDLLGLPTLTETVNIINGTATSDETSLFKGKLLGGVQGMMLGEEGGESSGFHGEGPKIQIDDFNKVDRNLLNSPNTHGNAPTFKSDGTPVEIHHEGQGAEGPFKEMHKSDHRLGENYKKNHPSGNKPLTKAERTQFKKDKTQYWKNEYPKQ